MCTGYGGGILNASSSNPTIVNCVFTSNYSMLLPFPPGDGMCSHSGSNPTVTNCIFWDYSSSEIEGDATVTYSDVYGGYTGTGNINADPNFVNPNDPDGNDNIWMTSDDGLRITDTRAIDAANGNVDPTEDILGNSRYDDPNWSNIGIGDPDCVDMGAYEKQSS
jgi:hypothetical protein